MWMITDDPVRDHEAWASEGDEWMERHRRGNAECCECHRLITTEDAYVLDMTDKMHTAVCEKCKDKALKILADAGLGYLTDFFDDFLFSCLMETPNEYD